VTPRELNENEALLDPSPSVAWSMLDWAAAVET